MSLVGHTVRSARYISLTTFKRSGEPVSTPVWIAPPRPDGPFRPDELVFVTIADSWKVKRLGRDPRVEVRPCDARGRVEDGAPTYAGTGRVLRGDTAVRATKAAIGDKYGRWYHAFASAEQVIKRLYPRYAARAAVALTLEPEAV